MDKETFLGSFFYYHNISTLRKGNSLDCVVSLSLSLSLFFLLSNSWGFVLHFLALALSSLVLSFLRTVSTCFALVWVMHDELSIHSKKCPVFFFFFWVTMPMY